MPGPINSRPIDLRLEDPARARAAHTKELEEQAAHLERENEQRRHEKAAEERLHRAEKENHDLQHPPVWPFNLLHSQAETEGPSIVAMADSAHDAAFDVSVAQHAGDGAAVDALHGADDHAAPDATHPVDHSHDAVIDPGAAA